MLRNDQVGPNMVQVERSKSYRARVVSRGDLYLVCNYALLYLPLGIVVSENRAAVDILTMTHCEVREARRSIFYNSSACS